MIFYDALKLIEIPILIFKGELRGSALSEEMLGRYVDVMPQVKIIRITDTGHDIFSSNEQELVKEVLHFCNAC